MRKRRGRRQLFCKVVLVKRSESVSIEFGDAISNQNSQ